MSTSASSVVIQNPILNSPFVEPRRHFRFDDGGAPNEVIGQSDIDIARTSWR